MFSDRQGVCSSVHTMKEREFRRSQRCLIYKQLKMTPWNLGNPKLHNHKTHSLQTHTVLHSKCVKEHRAWSVPLWSLKLSTLQVCIFMLCCATRNGAKLVKLNLIIQSAAAHTQTHTLICRETFTRTLIILSLFLFSVLHFPSFFFFIIWNMKDFTAAQLSTFPGKYLRLLFSKRLDILDFPK